MSSTATLAYTPYKIHHLQVTPDWDLYYDDKWADQYIQGWIIARHKPCGIDCRRTMPVYVLSKKVFRITCPVCKSSLKAKQYKKQILSFIKACDLGNLEIGI